MDGIDKKQNDAGNNELLAIKSHETKKGAIQMNFKNKKSIMVMALAITIIISMIIIPSAFGAEEAPTFGAEEDPVRYDAEMYAKYHGVSVDEAMRRFELQDIIGKLDEEVTIKEAETFAGLWLEHTPEFKVVVLFTRDAEEMVKPYIQSYPELAEIIEVRTAEMSLVDLQNTHHEILSSIRNLGISVDSEIDVYENCVKVYVADQVQFDKEMSDGKLLLPSCVDVITVEALVEPALDIYGGLTLSSGTSGFSVKTSDGTTGITTAAHCANTEWYNGVYLPLQQEREETYYDIQWHTTPLLDDINQIQWTSGGSTRAITGTKSRSNQFVGEYVQKYGKTTENTAGYITSKEATLSYIEDSADTFIKVESNIFNPVCDTGDSGGPWFLGYVAYGTTCGKDASGNGYYMAINYVSGIGVSVITSSE